MSIIPIRETEICSVPFAYSHSVALPSGSRIIEAGALSSGMVTSTGPLSGTSSTTDAEGDVGFKQIVYIKKGQACVTSDKTVRILSAGDLLIHSPMQFHSICSIDTKGFSSAGISFEAGGEGMELLKHRMFHLTQAEGKDLSELVSNASVLVEDHWIEHQLPALEFNLKANLLAAQLECFLLHLIRYNHAEKFPEPSQEFIDYQKIILILHDNYDKALLLDDISRLCNINVNTLKKKFQKYAGQGIMKTFQQIKFRYALPLLEKGQSISEVSARLSFSSPTYFSYAFRQEFGFSPVYYQKNRQKIIL